VSPSRRPLARVAASACALLLLTGCGTGLRAQTYLEKSTADSTNDAIGFLAVRNLAVLGPATGTSWPAGGSAPMKVTFVNEGGEEDRLVSASSPAATSVRIVGPASGLVLEGLTRELPGGSYVDVTLSFERNGSKTMLVPVQIVPGQVPREDHDYHVNETDSEGNPIIEEGAPQEGDNVVEDEGNPAGDNTQDPPLSE
jgi:copper(I)-binding protein